jgi:hypothetical protein
MMAYSYTLEDTDIYALRRDGVAVAQVMFNRNERWETLAMHGMVDALNAAEANRTTA